MAGNMSFTNYNQVAPRRICLPQIWRDKCGGGAWVRLEVVKGCLLRMWLLVAHTLSAVSLFPSLPGPFVPSACAICPHIFIGFLTPVDNLHPRLSAAATQASLGQLLKRADSNLWISLAHSLSLCRSLCVVLCFFLLITFLIFFGSFSLCFFMHHVRFLRHHWSDLVKTWRNDAFFFYNFH